MVHGHLVPANHFWLILESVDMAASAAGGNLNDTKSSMSRTPVDPARKPPRIPIWMPSIARVSLSIPKAAKTRVPLSHSAIPPPSAPGASDLCQPMTISVQRLSKGYQSVR